MKVEELIDRLTQLRSHMITSEVQTALGQIVVIDVQKHFKQQGPGWPPIKESYKRWKLAHHFDGRINIKTRTLMNSPTATPIPNGVRISFPGAESYAGYVNRARKFAYLSDAAKTQIKALQRKAMITAIRGSK